MRHEIAKPTSQSGNNDSFLEAQSSFPRIAPDGLSRIKRNSTGEQSQYLMQIETVILLIGAVGTIGLVFMAHRHRKDPEN